MIDYDSVDPALGSWDDITRLGSHFDALAYLWKEIGTPCIHLPQTHAIIQLIRATLDEVAPWALLVTETNVPHKENVSYFGDGANEAQWVYNFALQPLVLHAFQTGDVSTLSRWTQSLITSSDRTTLFNFSRLARWHWTHSRAWYTKRYRDRRARRADAPTRRLGFPQAKRGWYY